MTDPSEAGALFRAGRLQDAITAAGAAVRKTPADLAARILLAELLLFQGNLARADLILDATADLAPDAALIVAEFRQLLRADMARRQLRTEGRLPEFLADPTEAMSAVLAAHVALRTGDQAQAAAHAAIAEAARPRVAGERDDGSAFDDIRDADDLCAGIFEVLTTTGKYFWIATETVESIVFHPPSRPRDLFWRRASMSVHQGPDGDVYIPVTYASDMAELPDTIRLGRETDWRQSGEGPTLGFGQRIFLIGEEACSIMELGGLTLSPGTAL